MTLPVRHAATKDHIAILVFFCCFNVRRSVQLQKVVGTLLIGMLQLHVTCGMLTVSMDFVELHCRSIGLTRCKQLPRLVKASWYRESKE